MRGKRSKQYRKLMEQFSMTFGFREPYQILGVYTMSFTYRINHLLTYYS